MRELKTKDFAQVDMKLTRAIALVRHGLEDRTGHDGQSIHDRIFADLEGVLRLIAELPEICLQCGARLTWGDGDAGADLCARCSPEAERAKP